MIDELDALATALPAEMSAAWRRESATLKAYGELVERWGRVHNLTRIRGNREVAVRHFLDCAIGLDLTGPQEGARVADVGSGAGFPGMVWAILRRDLRITCIEKVQKKASFLESVRTGLGLENTRVLAADAFGVDERFDWATSRATLSGLQVARLSALADRLAIFLGPQGLPPKWDEEMSGWSCDVRGYELPDLGPRFIGVARKNGG